MSSRYVYQPFQDPQGEIRLVEITPGQESEVITVELTTLKRAAPETVYDCISYTWGKPDTAFEIIIDGKTLQVRRNLWLLLQHLRKTQITTRKLWIDAICIDQCNIEEKDLQVTNIGQVFRDAVNVLVWLDEASIDGTLQPEILGLFTYENVTVGRTLDSQLSKYVDIDSIHNGIMKCAYHVYWTRLWIVQELALANLLTSSTARGSSHQRLSQISKCGAGTAVLISPSGLRLWEHSPITMNTLTSTPMSRVLTGRSDPSATL
jgi:hypothetical protein